MRIIEDYWTMKVSQDNFSGGGKKNILSNAVVCLIFCSLSYRN